MTVTLIAENIIDADDFLSATEQEGARWSQPMPNSGNEGSLRPVVKGTPADLTFSNSTNLAGAAGGTTLVCGNLRAYGDHVFAGASVVLNSGSYSGQERTVSSFTQASGTLTVSSAFGGQVASGVTFTLTLEYDDLDYRLYDQAGGDLGSAYFKWSVDGGTTYLGRMSVNSTWLADTEIRHTGGAMSFRAPWRHPLVQADDGYWVLTSATSGGATYSHRCLDPLRGGNVWSTAVSVATDDDPVSLKKLKSGRLICLVNESSYGLRLYKSDDNGASWTWVVYYSGLTDVKDDTFADLIELANGDLLLAYTYDSADNVYCRKSTDGGETWGAAVTIAADTNNQLNPALCLCSDSETIICAYESDEDASGDYEIKCKRSTDGGATWGSVIAVIDFGEDITAPALIMDNQGYVYCAAQYGTGSKITMSVSYNKGASWQTAYDLHNPAALTYYPWLAQIGGTRLVCTYWDETNDLIKWVTHGMPCLLASGTTIFCPAETKPIELLCGAEVEWYGGAGNSGDTWDFEAEYDFSMTNLIEDSPSRPWRSEQDNIACAIVIDMGAAARHYADGVAFFGCNLRTLSFQMNISNTWSGSQLGPTACCTDENNDQDNTTGWTAVNATLSSEAGGDTGNCLKVLEDNTGTNPRAYCSFTTVVGQRYKVTFKCKAGDAATAGWQAWCSGTPQIELEYFTAEADWTEYTEYFTALETTTRIYMIHQSAQGTGTYVLFDDVEIVLVPNVDETASFDLTSSGVVDADSGANEVKDAALLANYKDHELKGKFLRFTSGTLSGSTFEILDNVGDYILCDGDTSSAATDDTFAVFQDKVAVTFTGGPYRYARISISAQHTADDYYQIGSMVLGRAVTLTDGFQAGYSKNHEYGITHLSTPAGGMISVFEYGRKRRYGLGFKSSANGRKELLALLDYLEDKNLCLILDNATLTDCQLVKLKGAVEQEHVIGEYFSLDAEFEEVL